MPVSLYTHRTERCRYALIALLLLPCLFARADAQEPVRWLNYTYDSTFRFGAHVAKFPRYLKDSVRLDFAQTYQGPADFTTADAQWQNRLRIADTIGFHYIYAPDPIRGVQLSGKVGEFYVRRNADVIFTKEIQTVVDSLVTDPLYSQYFVKSLRQPPVPGGPHQLLMGERLRFAGNTFQLPAQGFYDTGFQYYVPWPGWEELKDNLFTWKVELTMRAEEIPQSMPDSTVLAYAHLYRRVDTLQGADTLPGAGFPCLCAFYEPFDTLAITKAMYQTNSVDDYNLGFIDSDDGTQYYDVGKFVDFFRDSIYGTRDSVWNTGKDSGTIRVVDYSVLLPRLDVPIGESSLFSNNASLGWQTGIPDSCVTEYCTRLLDSLQGWGAVNPGTLNYGVSVESSDFDMKIYSTGLVPVTVVRAKLSHYFHHMTRQGLADTLIRLGITPFYRPENAHHNRVMLRFGVSDEPDPTTYRQTGILSTRTQDIMQESAIAQGLTENRNIYMNANHNYDGMRLFTGDMDTVRRKVVHVFPAQFYPIGVFVPMYYANPDTALMSEEALSITYKLNSLGDTVSIYRDSAISETESVRVFVRLDSLDSEKWIMGPSRPDYLRYTAEVQKNFGLFSDYRNVFSASTGPGEPMVSQLARAVDASRFKYSSRPNITSHPVWYVVQVHGQTGSNRRQMADFFRPPPTREEITAQFWLALNCGVDGLMLSDLVFTGELFGALRRTETGYRHDQEYDTLAEAELNPFLSAKTDRTWVGFKSRYEGIERAINHFRDTIVPVYENLVYNQKQMSVHDSAQTFASMPLVDTLMAEHAKQFDSTGFHHIGVFDPHDSTYLEVSHFLPGHRDSVGLARNAEYLIITNRRTWPLDFKTYTDTALGRMRRAARWDTARGYDYVQGGLGNIDVRRPWLALKNTTGVIADSFVVEKVGGGWLDTVAVGEQFPLDWIDPGWGAMYRVWPVQAGISTYATAFNNAVRAVNLSTDRTERFRTIVYERDSIVWLRMVDSTGAWTGEYMISDTADTVNANGTRTAWNMYPSIASSRDGATTCVVWERRDSAGDHTVESCLLLANHLTRDNIDTVLAARLPARLADAEPFASSSVAYRRRTPAIIGVDSGYIVAWSGLDRGVTVTALKDLPPGLLGSGTFSVWDTARIDDLKAAPWEVNYVLGIGDTTARFTTLASVPYDSTVQINGGYISGTETAPYTPPGEPVPGHYEDLLMAHLAYQQGAKNTGVGQQIVYHALGYRFPPSASTNTAPTIWASGAEHVTAKMRECSFLHPSIAVDSARVGVAFEIFQHNGSGVTWQKTIGLRFRDTVSTATTPRNWQTYVYRWGGPLRKLTNIIYHGSRYEYPSLTQFPAMGQGALEAVPEGGLAWHWSNPPGGEQNAQKMYRYGWTYVAGIADGQHPGMMLVPNVAGDPFSETGVLHRGTDAAQRSGVNVEGLASWYYPAYLQNTPGNEQRLFTDLPDDVLIHSSVEVGDTVFGDCVFETAKPKFRYDLVFTGGHTIHHPDHPDKWISGDPSDPDDFPTAPGLPPTFFDAPLGSTTLLDTLPDAWRVSRTGVFVAGEDPVTVRRIIVSTGAVVSWLGGYPYDSTLSMDADILMYAELVKLADSSVLWRSDTVSARALGTTGTVVDELLEVPVGSVADSGMPVFLRMQGIATEGVRYALDGGFRFYTQDSTGTTFSKRLRPGPGESFTSEVPAGLAVRVIPNPVRNSGELSLWIVQAGRVRGGVYDMLGNEVLELPELGADAGGEYRIALPLAGLRAGQYLVRVESGSERASAQFNVVR